MSTFPFVDILSQDGSSGADYGYEIVPTIEYDRLDGVSDAADEILRHPNTIVRAPVGTGKSTVLPRLLAARSSTTVLMIAPTQLLAVQLFDNARTHESVGGVPIEYYLYEGETWNIPPKGVVYMDSSNLTRLLTLGGPDVLTDKILYFDDTHAYDLYMTSYKRMTSRLPIRHLVRAIATYSVVKWFTPFVPGDQLQETKLESSDVLTWDSTNSTDYWHWLKTRPTLVFCDSDKDAAELRDRLRRRGNLVYRLTTRSSKYEFRSATKYITNRGANTLIADGSFKFGYNFGVDHVIDLIEGVCYEKVFKENERPEPQSNDQTGLEDEFSFDLQSDIFDESPAINYDRPSDSPAFDLSAPLPEDYDQRLLAFRYQVWNTMMDQILSKEQCDLSQFKVLTELPISDRQSRLVDFTRDGALRNRNNAIVEALALVEAAKRFLAQTNADPMDGRADRVARGIAVRVKSILQRTDDSFNASIPHPGTSFVSATTNSFGAGHGARVDFYYCLLNLAFGIFGSISSGYNLGTLSEFEVPQY